MLPESFDIPIIIVQHRMKGDSALLEEVLQVKCALTVKQADEKESIESGMVYTAPPGYHLLVEKDRSLSLSCDPPIGYSRPSIDVLFETAAAAYKDGLTAIILTGANGDGAGGIRHVRRYGGTTIAQDPGTAEHSFMPQAAVNTGDVQHVLRLEAIGDFLKSMEKLKQ
jgi:two-component system chemotaxis response regulator CheB